MTDILRRNRYVENRVLIETARVLNPQFKSAVLRLTGAQLECLRNLTAYLNRESTFAEYFSCYYLSPTASEWDSLQSIVADLEDSLMTSEMGIYGWDGSEWRKLPLLWGLTETYVEREDNLSAEAGTNDLTFTAVLADEVWVVQGVFAYNFTSACSRITCRATIGAVACVFAEILSPGVGVSLQFGGPLVLPTNASLYVRFEGCTLNDDLYAWAWGYKMKIAE